MRWRECDRSGRAESRRRSSCVAEKLIWFVDRHLVVGWAGLHLVGGDLVDEGPAEVPDEEDLGSEEQAGMVY